MVKAGKGLSLQLLNKEACCEVCGGCSIEVVYKQHGTPKEKYFITDDSYGTHGQIVKCLGCELFFVSPREKDQKIHCRYSSFSDLKYEKERLSRGESQKGIIEKCEEIYGKKGRLLDVGCATGVLLEVAKKRGWDTIGVEPSKWATKIARVNYNLDVFNGTLDSLKLKRKYFDVVTCIDVIEHVVSPRMLLANIYSLLKDDGLLCIVTPDIKSLAAKMLGERWWHVRPDHIYYFSMDSLTRLLESEGFRVETISRYAWNFSFDYWASRFKNKIPFVYKILMIFISLPFIGFLAKRTYCINFYDSMAVYAKKR